MDAAHGGHAGLSPQALARLGISPDDLQAGGTLGVEKAEKVDSQAVAALKNTASTIGAIASPLIKGIATTVALLALGLAAAGTNLVMLVKNPKKELYTTSLLKQAYLPSARQEIPPTASNQLNRTLKRAKASGKAFTLQTERGATIDGKLCTPDPKKANGKTVVLFNGNSGLYEGNIGTINSYLKMGYQVCAFNYGGIGEGEGSSPGSADELIGDGRAVLDHLMEKEGVESENLLLHGHSMGGAVACALGAEHPEADLRVDRSYSKYSDAAHDVLSAENNMSPLASVVTTIVSKFTYLPSIVSSLVKHSRFEIDSTSNLQNRLEAQDSLNITPLNHVVSAGEDEILGERSALPNHMEAMAHQERITRTHIAHFNHTQELGNSTLEIGRPEVQAAAEKTDGRGLTLEDSRQYRVDLMRPNIQSEVSAAG